MGKAEILYIVIPAYNEEENIEQCVNDWYPVVESHDGEGSSRLVIVNDGSKDRTYEKLQALAETRPLLTPLNKVNGGHGSAVLYGYQYAADQDYGGFYREEIQYRKLLLYPPVWHLLAIEGNIVDLLDPFQKGWYYKKEIGGSFSIKSVLPAICPDDPELDYHELEGVHNGTEAMTIFPQIQYMMPEEQEQVRKNLLAYCRLDTLAMVKVWEELRRAAM